ncbi:MAG TPA: PAS domain S-box protein [Chitinophagaceae bacterium]
MNTSNVSASGQLLKHHFGPPPFALITWAPDLTIAAWSHEAEVLFGWKEEEIKGKHLFDFPLVYEEDIPIVSKLVTELLQGETDRFIGTNRNRCKDGSVVHSVWYCYVLKDAAGQVISYLSLVQDVTEKARQDAALRRANERLSLLTSATNDGIWEWDVVQNKVWTNDAFITTYGYNPQDYPDFYNEWLSRLHPDDCTVFLEHTAAAWERKDRNWSGEFRFRLADGSYGTILQKTHFIYSSGGDLQKAVGVDINVTHLRQTEAALRLSEEKFSKAFRSSPVPIVIIHQPSTFFTDVNDAFCRLTGFSKEELLGQSYRTLNIAPLQSIQHGEALLEQQGYLKIQRLELRHKDGSALYCLISADVLHIDGESYLLSTMFDITEQVKAEAALRFHEQQLELVYNTISDVVFLLDVQGEDRYRFITVNKSFLASTGLKAGQVVGQWVHEVIPEPSLSLVLQHYRQAIAAREKMQWEEITSYPAGTKTGIVSVTPVFNDEGTCIRLVGTVHDITEQKRAAEELSRSYQEIRQLAAHLQDVREDERTAIAREIHDELGQLLTALKMDVSWLRRIDTLSADEVARRVASVNTLLDGAINTVRNIAAELRPSILDDLGLVEALSWQSREFEKRYGVPIVFTTNTPGVELTRDVATALFRVFQESLTNVARHAKAHQVEAILSLSPDTLTLQVSDDGIGFEQEKIATQKTLGLTGIRERIAAINGQFQLQTAPGRGTTITARAPLPPANTP